MKEPLRHIFKTLLKKVVFQEISKTTKNSTIMKTGKNRFLANFRSISALPCFLRILGRIIYNKFYSYLNQNNILINSWINQPIVHLLNLLTAFIVRLTKTNIP